MYQEGDCGMYQAKQLTISSAALFGGGQITKETQIHSKMQHKNIMRLHEFYMTRTKLYLVMELMRGGSLLDLILERGGLKEGDAKLVFRQVRLADCTYQLSITEQVQVSLSACDGHSHARTWHRYSGRFTTCMSVTSSIGISSWRMSCWGS